MKKAIALMLLLALLSSLATFPAAAKGADAEGATAEQIIQRLDHMTRNCFREGDYFTVDGKGVPSAPYPVYERKCIRFHEAQTCCAFSAYVFYYLFGLGRYQSIMDSQSAEGTKDRKNVTDFLRTCQPGDIIHYYRREKGPPPVEDQHWVVVYKVNTGDASITVYEANRLYREGGVAWKNRVWSTQKLRAHNLRGYALWRYRANEKPLKDWRMPVLSVEDISAKQGSLTARLNLNNSGNYPVIWMGYYQGATMDELRRSTSRSYINLDPLYRDRMDLTKPVKKSNGKEDYNRPIQVSAKDLAAFKGSYIQFFAASGREEVRSKAYYVSPSGFYQDAALVIRSCVASADTLYGTLTGRVICSAAPDPALQELGYFLWREGKESEAVRGTLDIGAAGAKDGIRDAFQFRLDKDSALSGKGGRLLIRLYKISDGVLTASSPFPFEVIQGPTVQEKDTVGGILDGPDRRGDPMYECRVRHIEPIPLPDIETGAGDLRIEDLTPRSAVICFTYKGSSPPDSLEVVGGDGRPLASTTQKEADFAGKKVTYRITVWNLAPETRQEFQVIARLRGLRFRLPGGKGALTTRKPYTICPVSAKAEGINRLALSWSTDVPVRPDRVEITVFGNPKHPNPMLPFTVSYQAHASEKASDFSHTITDMGLYDDQVEYRYKVVMIVGGWPYEGPVGTFRAENRGSFASMEETFFADAQTQIEGKYEFRVKDGLALLYDVHTDEASYDQWINHPLSELSLPGACGQAQVIGVGGAFPMQYLAKAYTLPEGYRYCAAPLRYTDMQHAGAAKIPSTLCHLEGSLFNYLRVEIHPENRHYAVDNGALLDKASGALIATRPSSSPQQPAPQAPQGITTIASEAYSYRNIPYLELPAGLKTIEGGAFVWLSGDNEIVLPEGTTSIGELAFGFLDGTLRLTIPPSVTYIDPQAFLSSEDGLVLIVTQGSYAHEVASLRGLDFEFK